MKSRFPIVDLGKYVRQISQRNRSDSGIEVFSVTNSEGFTRSIDYFSKEVFSKDVSNYKIVSPGQFAYNPSRINVGSIDYLRADRAVLVSPLYVVFEGSENICADYLLRYLRSDWGSAQIRANTEGAVRDSLKFKGLENIKIPLPPIDVQIRIAQLLAKVEGLVAQRKQHLQELDRLLKGAFLNMFGPSNPGYEDWPLVEIRDLAAQHKGSMRTGPFGSNLLHSEFMPEGDVAVLGIDNAVQNRFAWGERRFISKEKYQELQSYRVFPGDVIVTIMGTIGRSAVIPDDIPVAINTKHLAAITLNREVANPTFLSYAIHSSPYVLKQFESKNRGAIMSGLNLGLIKETTIRRAPIELQDRFAEIHKSVEQLKSRYQQSLDYLDRLYGALSQQAFKGELDVSRINLPQRPTQHHDAKPSADQDAVPEPTMKAVPSINLPATDKLSAELEKVGTRKAVIEVWLDAYRGQLGGSPFSVQEFLAAAQSQLIDLMPGTDLELSASDYEHVKAWVFEALAAGTLTQEFDDDGNRIKIRTVTA